MRLLSQLGCCWLVGVLAAPAVTKAADWPLWKAYAERFITPAGRVLTRRATIAAPPRGRRTVCSSRWPPTTARPSTGFWPDADSSGAGRPAERLPGWLWSRGDNGDWGLRDANPASDADVWLAYTLLEAGSLWDDPALSRLGMRLADRIAADEVRQLAGLGPMLMPGPKGFRPASDLWQLNPSYWRRNRCWAWRAGCRTDRGRASPP